MSELAEIISRNEDSIRTGWINDIAKSVQRSDLISRAELEEQCRALLNAILNALRYGGSDVSTPGWSSTRELLSEISASRTRQGFSPTEVATFVLSLK
jgi:rsbT co-antagonist protein RsbR